MGRQLGHPPIADDTPSMEQQFGEVDMRDEQTKLTKAQIRSLEAVQRGTVERLYRGSGNVFLAPKGTSATTFWRLDQLGLISDGPHKRGIFEIVVTVILTPTGRAAIEKATP